MADDAQSISWKEFLESQPPNGERRIVGLCEGPPEPYKIIAPELELYCDKCDGVRFFWNIGQDILINDLENTPFHDDWMPFMCKNCSVTIKNYAIRFKLDKNGKTGKAMKFGEQPPFGPMTPPRVLRFIQPDKELFLTGRRAECQGMGIGAFAYYRRVVENQKNRVIDEIIKASKRLNASPTMIAALDSAKTDFRFSNAIENIEPAIPEALKIQGHNPLTLLHAALSKGIHSHSEEECLEMAQSIRLVLTELAERIDSALQDDAELNQAVSRLMQAGSKPKQTTAPAPPPTPSPTPKQS